MKSATTEADLLVRLLQRSIRLINVVGSDDPLSDLTLSQKRIVRAVREASPDAPSTVSSLAQEMSLTPSAVTQCVRGLLDLGLLKHGESEDDRRQKPLQLTETGEKLMNDRANKQRTKAERLLASLGRENARQVLEALVVLASCAGAPDEEASGAGASAEVEEVRL